MPRLRGRRARTRGWGLAEASSDVLSPTRGEAVKTWGRRGEDVGKMWGRCGEEEMESL